MKRVLCFILLTALVLLTVSCGKKADDGEKPDGTENGTLASDPSERESETEGQSGTESGTVNGPEDETPVLTAGTGEYSDDGVYTPPQKIDGGDVIYHGTYDKDGGVSVTVPNGGVSAPEPNDNTPKPNGGDNTPEPNGGNNTTEPDGDEEPTHGNTTVEPPKEDMYKKAADSLGSYTAKTDFCYYVDMDDGWHESHPFSTTVKYNKDNDSYEGNNSSGKGASVYYDDGVYTSSSGEKQEVSADVFLRQCNLLTPLELDKYNFEMSEDVTVVSAVLDAADHKYKLMMSSNFFNGYEKDTADNITMGKLYYTAKINANGRLIYSEYGFNFTVASSIGDQNITVTVKTQYE